MNEPMTEAGKRLLNSHAICATYPSEEQGHDRALAVIARIEAEAARTATEQAERLEEALRQAVKDTKTAIRSESPSTGLVHRADVRTSSYDPLVRESVVYARLDDLLAAVDRAALRDTATPARQAEGLDAMRLAHAMHAIGLMCWMPRSECKPEWIGEVRHDVHLGWAAAIARAYADNQGTGTGRDGE